MGLTSFARQRDMPLGSTAVAGSKCIESFRRASGHQAVQEYSGLRIEIHRDSMLWLVWNQGSLEPEQNRWGC
jgi:hypothetical protein